MPMIYETRSEGPQRRVSTALGGESLDARFARGVVLALEWDAYVPVEGIRVTVRDRWVTLEGEVEWEYQRRDAERVIRCLLEAKGVTNNIQVKPSLSPARLQHLIERGLRASGDLDASRIRVDVQHGEVNLRGSVDTAAERAVAERIAWSAPVVTEVHNLLWVASS